ncbi:hypothetical protein [Streptomyces californicus]|uniref:hypothetical protein n=1 Tax=Streptomyces californicus TaxID=67351 RepID=UPI0037A679F4
MEKPTDQTSVPAPFAPVLRAERFDEVVWYDAARTAMPPERTYERLWQGQCGPDITVEDGDEIVRPVRLRVRWLQNGEAAPRWNSIEVTSYVVLPGGKLGCLPVRMIWTHHHASREQIPDAFLQFVAANPPALRSAG